MKFLAILLLATPALGQVQIVSLDRIDVDHLPPAPSKSTVCECGCLDGGVCTCPNCPNKARETLVVNRSKLLPDGSPDTIAPGIAGLFNVVDRQAPPVQYRPPQKQVPLPFPVRAPGFTSTRGYSACANGQCGPRGILRRGLFGRRR